MPSERIDELIKNIGDHVVILNKIFADEVDYLKNENTKLRKKIDTLSYQLARLEENKALNK
jgi:hypothetical protein